MDVIDALCVTLGLDKADFDKGHEDAREQMTKTRETAKRSATDTERESSAAQTQQKKQVDLAVKRQRELDDMAKKVTGTISNATAAVTGMFAAFQSVRGFAQFSEQVATSNANTSRLAGTLEQATGKVQVWERAVAAIGGSAGDADAAMAGLSDTYSQFATGRGAPHYDAIAALGIDPAKLRDSNNALELIRQKMLAFAKPNTARNNTQTAMSFGRELVGNSMATLLMDPNYNAIMAASKPTVIDQHTADVDKAHQEAMSGLASALRHLDGVLTDHIYPSLDAVAKAVSDWVNHITKPGNEAELGGTVVAGVGAGVVASKAAGAVVRKVVGGLLPKAASGEVAAGAAGGLLSRAAVPLAAGYAVHELDSGDNIGQFVDNNIPGAKIIDDWWHGIVGGQTQGEAAPASVTTSPTSDDSDPFTHIKDGTFDQWLKQKPHPASPSAGQPLTPAQISDFANKYSGGGSSAAPAAPSGKPATGKAAFVAANWAAAMAVSARTGVDPRLVIAQAGLESGWGTHAPGNNLFGIKYHLGDGKFNSLRTHETINGRDTTPVQNFQAYGSQADSFKDYGDTMLRVKNYKHLLDVARNGGSLADQIAAQASSGYATDKHYGDKLTATVAGMSPGDRWSNTASNASSNSSTTIGDINVYTNSTNGKQIASDIMNEMQRYSVATQANTGMR